MRKKVGKTAASKVILRICPLIVASLLFFIVSFNAKSKYQRPRRCRTPSHTDYVPRLEDVYYVSKAERLPKEYITVATQLSLDRLPCLEGICAAWPYQVVASVFVSPEQAVDMSSVREKISEFVGKLKHSQTAPQCSLELVALAYEPGLCEESRPCDYPYNSLRNRAILMVRTKAMLMMDADFLPSSTLRKYSEGARLEMVLHAVENKIVLVVPAFGTTALDVKDTDDVGLDRFLNDKAALVEAYTGGTMPAFYERVSASAQGPSNIPHWLQATKPYPVEFEYNYEPYFIMDCSEMPWYDERFVGYFRDKTQHVAHVNGLHFSFQVLHDVFMIHRAHPPSHAHNDTNPWFYSRNVALSNDIAQEIAQDTFVPMKAQC